MKINLNPYDDSGTKDGPEKPVKRNDLEITLGNGMKFSLRETPSGLEVTAIESRSTSMPSLSIHPAYGNVLYLRAVKR